jgi:hypothetical protein
VILGDDRHHPGGRKHLKHLIVVGVGKRPVFNDAGAACHLNDERLIIRSCCAKNRAPRSHRRIVTDAVCSTHLVLRAMRRAL